MIKLLIAIYTILDHVLVSIHITETTEMLVQILSYDLLERRDDFLQYIKAVLVGNSQTIVCSAPNVYQWRWKSRNSSAVQ